MRTQKTPGKGTTGKRSDKMVATKQTAPEEKLPVLDTFGKRLEYMLKLRGMRQTVLASKVPIAESHISGMRRGRTHPSRESGQKIAKILGVSHEWLLFGGAGGPVVANTANKAKPGSESPVADGVKSTGEEDLITLQTQILVKDIEKNMVSCTTESEKLEIMYLVSKALEDAAEARKHK